MRKTLSVLIGLAAVLLALYVGLVVMFVGGIAQVVDAINATPTDGGEVAWGVVRIVFASAATSITLWGGVALAYITWPQPEPRRRW